MLKGAQKRMIVIKTAKSSVFDEAYFLVKPNLDIEELDMIAEADKIARGVLGAEKEKKKKPRGEMKLYFIVGLLGVLAGALFPIIFILIR